VGKLLLENLDELGSAPGLLVPSLEVVSLLSAVYLTEVDESNKARKEKGLAKLMTDFAPRLTWRYARLGRR